MCNFVCLCVVLFENWWDIFNYKTFDRYLLIFLMWHRLWRTCRFHDGGTAASAGEDRESMLQEKHRHRQGRGVQPRRWNWNRWLPTSCSSVSITVSVHVHSASFTPYFETQSPAGMGLDFAWWVTAPVVKGSKTVWDHLRKARVFWSVCPQGRVLQM